MIYHQTPQGQVCILAPPPAGVLQLPSQLRCFSLTCRPAEMMDEAVGLGAVTVLGVLEQGKRTPHCATKWTVGAEQADA